MSIGILTAILGFLSSLIPSVIGYFQRRNELEHELEITRLTVEAAKSGYELNAKIEDLKTIVLEGQSVRGHDLGIGYSGFFESLRASIRPTITYAIFAFFMGLKLTVVYIVFSTDGLTFDTIKNIHNLILDETTVAIFGSVIGFWFGSRQLSNMDDYLSSRYTADKMQPTKKTK